MGRFALPRIAVSAHATDIQLKDADRNEIAGKVAAFLQKNTIQAAPASTKSREVKPTFNTAISVTPSRQTAVATDKEEIALARRNVIIISKKWRQKSHIYGCMSVHPRIASQFVEPEWALRLRQIHRIGDTFYWGAP